MFESSTVPMAVADENGLLVHSNGAYLEMVGRTLDQVVGRSSRDWTHPDDIAEHHAMQENQAAAAERGEVYRSEKRYLRPDGEVRWGWVSAAPAVGPAGETFTVAVIHDTTDRRHTEDALQVAVSTDSLTGLLNRRGWRERVAAATRARLAASGTPLPLALAMIDLDNFKAYNDTHGHAAGDRLLSVFSAAATEVLGSEALLARWGGEEFALALTDCTPDEVAKVLVDLAGTVPYGQTFSAGWVLRAPAEDLMDCLDRADERLYRAKRDGGQGRVYGDPVETPPPVPGATESPFLANGH